MTHRPPALLFVLITLGACAKRQQGNVDPVDALVIAADKAWEARDRDGLEAAQEPLQQAYGIAQHRPDVLWRLVRYHHALGLVEERPRAALYEWAEARSLGIDCLETEPTVATARRTRGWGEALELVPSSHDLCTAWTSMAWARWIATFGSDAAASDLPTAMAFARHGAASTDPATRQLGTWSEAILLATAPQWADGNPAVGLAHFERLIEERPKHVLLKVDRYVFAGAWMSDDYRMRVTEELGATTSRWPEEAAALGRIDAR